MINLNLTPELAQDMANLAAGRTSVSTNVQATALAVRNAPATVPTPAQALPEAARTFIPDNVNVHAGQVPHQPEEAATVLMALADTPQSARAAPNPQLQQVQTWSNKYTLNPEQPQATAQKLAQFVEAPENIPVPTQERAQTQAQTIQTAQTQFTQAPQRQAFTAQAQQLTRSTLPQAAPETSAHALPAGPTLTPDAVSQAAAVMPEELPAQLLKVLADAGQPFAGETLFQPSDVPVADLPDAPQTFPAKTAANENAPQANVPQPPTRNPNAPQAQPNVNPQTQPMLNPRAFQNPVDTRNPAAPRMPMVTPQTPDAAMHPQDALVSEDTQAHEETQRGANPTLKNQPMPSVLTTSKRPGFEGSKTPAQARNSQPQRALLSEPESWSGEAAQTELHARAQGNFTQAPEMPPAAFPLPPSAEMFTEGVPTQVENESPQTQSNALPEASTDLPELNHSTTQPQATAHQTQAPTQPAQAPMFVDPGRAELFASLPQNEWTQTPAESTPLPQTPIPQQAPNGLPQAQIQVNQSNPLPEFTLSQDQVPQQAPNLDASLLAVRQALDFAFNTLMPQAEVQGALPQAQAQTPQSSVPPQAPTSTPGETSQPARAFTPQGSSNLELANTAKTAGQPQRAIEVSMASQTKFLQAARMEMETGAVSAMKSGQAFGVEDLQNAKLTQTQTTGTLRQWSGWLPVQLGDQKTPAWIQFEWQKPEDQGRGKADPQAPAKPIPVSLALHLKSERLGWVGFHLAWAPPELTGSMVVENASVANLASGELRALERRLSSDDTPLVHVDIQRKVNLSLD